MKDLFTNRWFLISAFASIITFFGWKWLDFFKLAPGWQAFVYTVVLLIILLINYIRIYKNGGSSKLKFNPFHHIPTTAALFRFIIAFLLTITFLSKVYTNVFALFYLLYIYVLSSTYDLPNYHRQDFRALRIFIDLVFASIAFIIFGGLYNLTWLMFLIPLMTTARHYSSWEPLGAFAYSCCFITITSIFVKFHSQFPTIDIIPIINAIFGDLLLYLQKPEDKLNWTLFKQLILVNIVFAVVVFIFKAEWYNRYGKIYAFVKKLISLLKTNGKQIDDKLIDFLCEELNAEGVLYIYDNKGKVTYQSTFQSNTKNSGFCVSKMGKLDSDTIEEFNNWWISINDFINETKEKYNDFGKTMKWLKMDLMGLYNTEEINQLDKDNCSALQKEFESIFFKKNGSIDEKHFSLLKFRDTHSLYSNFEIVSIVPMKFGSIYLFFINNFPTKFRVVPRKYWEDGMQKLRMTKYLLD